MTKPYIHTIPPYKLLDMFVSEVQRLHYDPCSDGERAEYDKWEMHKEIERRMNRLEDIEGHLESRSLD